MALSVSEDIIFNDPVQTDTQHLDDRQVGSIKS